MRSSISAQPTSDSITSERTRALLLCGVIAGPLFAIVGLIQAFTRPGFDLRRHALSALENGDLGWLQRGSFVLTGLLFLACAVGMRQVLRGSLAGTWGPLLIGVYSAGMIGAGIFNPDPVPGFPPGTPASATSISGRGLIHFSVATVGFLALIVACFVWARRFAAQQRRGWVVYSAITGVSFFLAFAGEASGQLYLNTAFVFTALNAFVWVSVMAALLLSERG
jgi:hypothetical protein